MTKFPPDKPQPEYNQDLLTRLVEDIYDNLGSTDKALKILPALQEAIENLSSDVGEVQQSLALERGGQSAVMPTPSGLTVLKLPGLPVVVAWCKPIEIIKYPFIKGVQFFASPEYNFTPLPESGYVSYNGTHTGAGISTTLSDTSEVTVSSIPGITTNYVGIPFWKDMNLVADAVGMINTTTGDTGNVTSWDSETPWEIGTDVTWNPGDGYSFTIERDKNMIGQGPLPFAVGIYPLLKFNNKKWDTFGFYVKARFYSKGDKDTRVYGSFSCASTTGLQDQGLEEPINVTAEAYEEAYEIQVRWNAGHDGADALDAFSHYKVYRTLANVAPTDDTDLIADNITTTLYVDKGYDAVKYPNGPVAGTIYYYWVQAVDTGGHESGFDTSDSAILVVPNDPVFISGEEAESTGYGNLKSWLVKWKNAGGAIGYYIKYKITTGEYSPVTYVPFENTHGQDGGEYIQQFTFDGLEAGRNYTFAVQAINNATVAALQSNWVTQAYDVDNDDAPLPPT